MGFLKWMKKLHSISQPNSKHYFSKIISCMYLFLPIGASSSSMRLIKYSHPPLNDTPPSFDTLFTKLISHSILHQFLQNKFWHVVQAHIYHCTKFGCNWGNIEDAVEFSKWTVFGHSWNTVTPLNDTPIILVFLCEILFNHSEIWYSHGRAFM